MEREDKISDVFACYEQAFKLFPECEMVVNNLGAQLFRYSLYIDFNDMLMFVHMTTSLGVAYRELPVTVVHVIPVLFVEWALLMKQLVSSVDLSS